jgi:hypothetical protein
MGALVPGAVGSWVLVPALDVGSAEGVGALVSCVVGFWLTIEGEARGSVIAAIAGSPVATASAKAAARRARLASALAVAAIALATIVVC